MLRRTMVVGLLVLWGSLAVGADERRSEGLLGRGTEWQTAYYVQQSDVPGPIVVITGGVHGNEPAGAAAAEAIRGWPICRGTLVVLPRANPRALAADARYIPGEKTDLANLNRNFPRARKEEPARGKAAEEIWQWVARWKPAWLVDLHEGFGTRAAGSKSVGSSVIATRSPEMEAAVERMLAAVNATIEEDTKKFVRLGLPVDGSLARAAAEHLGAQAMICETTSGGQPLSRRARQHRLLVHALLVHLEMIAADADVDRIADRAAAPTKTWVALYDAGGTGGQGAANVEQIVSEAGMAVRRVGPEEIQAGALRQFDLVVVPGGSASKQAAAIGEPGRRALLEFVQGGRGYLGICAGAYLATSGFPWSLNILDARTASPLWKRGMGTVQIELTPEGRAILGGRPGRHDVRYANGPILVPAQRDDLPDYQVLAWFRTELAENKTPAGLMVNSPAIVAGHCAQGRVVAISPHPERPGDLQGLVLNAVLWAAGKQPAPTEVSQ